MEFPIQKLGIIVLAVLVLIAVILLVTTGISGQSGALNETSQSVISNLTESVENVR
ncbi:hypothetical protein GF352_04815 [archaeon]|nr:hypothetical protein [archaeon]